ncbi:MAG: hypothetical protein IJ332_03680 [Clostridia bacterium]|nr:hypothetical protein [Clostridia bacterium]
MNYKLKEILIGIAYSVVTMVFMIGILPWTLVSSIIACVVAMLAILRIRKKTHKEENVNYFTISYMAVIIICMLLLNSLSISA